MFNRLGAKSLALVATVSSAFINPVGSNSQNNGSRSMSYKVNSPIPVPVPPDSCAVINKDVKACNKDGKFTVAGLNNGEVTSTFHEQDSFYKSCYIRRGETVEPFPNNVLSATCDGSEKPSIYVNYDVKKGLWVQAQIEDKNGTHARIKFNRTVTQEL